MDRDPVFTADFRDFLDRAGMQPVRLPARSPNLNAFAERFVLSIKSECLNKLILLGPFPNDSRGICVRQSRGRSAGLVLNRRYLLGRLGDRLLLALRGQTRDAVDRYEAYVAVLGEL